MAHVPIDELLARCGSIYKLVVIASKRAKELSEGSPRFIETDSKKSTSIALEEIRQGKIVYESDEPSAKPKRGRAEKSGASKGKARLAKAAKKS